MGNSNKSQRRFSLKHAALATVKALGEATLQFIDEGLLNPRYPFTHPSRALLGLPPPNRYSKDNNHTKKSYTHRTLSITLLRLKKAGLVKNTGEGRTTKWMITSGGEKFLHSYITNILEHDMPPKDGKKRIVLFDIPEKMHAKRRWLRSELIAFDYTMLQKSAWIGERPLPQSFIKNLATYQLEQYVHIFEISKKGTL